jgi:hypothetical protein
LVILAESVRIDGKLKQRRLAGRIRRPHPRSAFKDEELNGALGTSGPLTRADLQTIVSTVRPRPNC